MKKTNEDTLLYIVGWIIGTLLFGWTLYEIINGLFL